MSDWDIGRIREDAARIKGLRAVDRGFGPPAVSGIGELPTFTPQWAEPLIPPARYKAAHGGRSSGKSQFFGERAVADMVHDPDLRFVCIREVQRSLRYSAKALVEAKIHALGVASLFRIMEAEIRRIGGDGVMIFQGMQNHTADSIKSLEGFGRAWVEEAQNLSQRSLDFLLPTIRAEGSEVWFSWNPDQPDDPVDELFRSQKPDNAVVVSSTYLDNPLCPQEAIDEAERRKRIDPDGYAHIWLGGYNVRSDAQVLAGRWRVDEFEPNPEWDGPYFGADWGFSQDPTVLVRFWIGDGRLWVEHEARGVGVGLDDIPALFSRVPGHDSHRIRGDNSRPETIAYLRTKGLDVVAAPKWSGSVEDGVEWMRKFEEIVIHPRCSGFQDEARLWRYKVDRLTGDPLPKLADGNDHGPDALRYGAAPMIKPGPKVGVYFPGMDGAA